MAQLSADEVAYLLCTHVLDFFVISADKNLVSSMTHCELVCTYVGGRSQERDYQ